MKGIRLKNLLLRLLPEWCVLIVLFAITLLLAEIIHAPLRMPSTGVFLFIGLTYLMPFLLMSIWILLPWPFLIYRGEFKDATKRVLQQISYLFCFGMVMMLHFHIKLWAPLINPISYDPVYETIDRTCFFWMDPLIAWRGHWQIDWVNHLYFYLFLFMFVCSFIVHYLQGPGRFARVFLSSLLVQAFGAIAYLVAPAVGPFIYREGANTHVTSVEHNLLQIHQQLVAGGSKWLENHTDNNLAAGLAAMPSLHIAASSVFLYYAIKYSPWLAWIYWPCFAWFLFESMASGWHYGIDLIFGLVLSGTCIFLANAWMKAHEDACSGTADK